MFPTVIAPALEILDYGKVTKIQCKDCRSRSFYRVKEPTNKSNSSRQQQSFGGASSSEGLSGAGESLHDVVGEFCFCYFFAKECINENGSSLFCKHVLACKLAEALESVHILEIDDKDYSPLLL
jgi:hypothetical protein